jgi:hypothetical protein
LQVWALRTPVPHGYRVCAFSQGAFSSSQCWCQCLMVTAWSRCCAMSTGHLYSKFPAQDDSSHFASWGYEELGGDISFRNWPERAARSNKHPSTSTRETKNTIFYMENMPDRGAMGSRKPSIYCQTTGRSSNGHSMGNRIAHANWD